LKEEIVDKRGGRLLAGYAWDWNKNIVDGKLANDVVIEEHNFALPWKIELTGPFIQNVQIKLGVFIQSF
jgi:hypothetical protein